MREPTLAELNLQQRRMERGLKSSIPGVSPPPAPAPAPAVEEPAAEKPAAKKRTRKPRAKSAKG